MSMAVDFSLHYNPEEILSGREEIRTHWKDEKKRNE